MRLAAALSARRGDMALRGWRARRAAIYLSGAGTLTLVAGLVQLPHPVGVAHAVLAAAALLLLAGAHRSLTPPRARGAVEDAGTPRERIDELCETLERRLEQLQDVHWEISESDVRYRDLLDQQSDVILRRDPEGRLTFVNSAFERLFGIAQDAAIGTVFRPEIIEGSELPAIDIGRPDRGQRRLEQCQTIIGPRWLAWDEHVVTDGEAAASEVQVVGRDVTEECRKAAELAEARDQAEAANRAKSRFLAAMSHEIRTPMNGILGMASLLRETETSEEQLTYIAAIDQSARVLVALIDEILDFSKIEAGKLVLAENPFLLAATAQSVIELLSPRAHEKGLELALLIDPSVERTVMGDEARIRQILLNLLSNAVKFTDQGGISVSVSARRCGEESSKLRVEMVVEDSGIGLSAEDMQFLFLEFEQADAAARRRQGGTGLGLAISKRLARAMGGDIRVSSAPGHGSTFVAEIVLKDVGQKGLAAEATRPEAGEANRVLVAMDRVFERRSIAHILRSAGHDVVEAGIGGASLAIEEAARRGQPLDRLIVDVGGDAAAAGRTLSELRQAAGATAVIGIVTVNVLARSGLREFRKQGFERYLVRPVRVASLLQQLASRPMEGEPDHRDDGERSGQTSGTSAVTGAPGALRRAANGDAATVVRAHVLLVEDNEINALLARRVLEMSGCVVEHRADGAKGLAAAHDVIAGLRPPFDLILMDIHMPGLDGIATAKAIREAYRDAAAHTGALNVACPPIVVLTANAFPEDRARYLAEGLDDYLAKPFDLAALKSLLDTWLRDDARTSLQHVVGGRE